MIAIKRPNGDLIWLDAVLSFQESYSSAVTKHQIESGSSITDHTIRNNPTFSLSGVVSAVEFNGGVSALEVFAATPAWMEVSTDFGADLEPGYVQIGTSLSNPLIKLLPDSLRQFVGGDDTPDVAMGTSSGSTSLKEIKDVLVALNTGFTKYDETKKKYYTDIELLTLVEFNSKLEFVQGYYNCICTGVSFSQDPESGDAIYPQMSFEGVRFVTLTQTKLPDSVSKQVKTKSSDKVQKGGANPKASGTTAVSDATQGPVVARSGLAKSQGLTGGFSESALEQ